MEISLGEMLSAALGGCPEDGFAPPTPSPFNPYQLCQANFRQPNRNYNPPGSCAFNVGLQSHNSAPARVAIPEKQPTAGVATAAAAEIAGQPQAKAKGRTKNSRNNTATPPVKKRVRNKVPNPDEWQVNIRKKACAEGKEYISRRGKKVGPKVVINLKNCLANCQYRCAKHVSEEKRKEINRAYYSLKNQTQKRDFLIHTTVRCLTKRPKNFNPRPKGRPPKDEKKAQERRERMALRKERREKREKAKKEKEKLKKQKAKAKKEKLKRGRKRTRASKAKRRRRDSTEEEEEEEELDFDELDKDKEEEAARKEKEKNEKEKNDKSKKDKNDKNDKESESATESAADASAKTNLPTDSSKSDPTNDSNQANTPNDLSKTSMPNDLSKTNMPTDSNSNPLTELNKNNPLNVSNMNNSLNGTGQNKAPNEMIQNNPYDLHKNHPFSDMPQTNPFDLHRNPFDLHRNPFDLHRNHPFSDLNRNIPFNDPNRNIPFHDPNKNIPFNDPNKNNSNMEANTNNTNNNEADKNNTNNDLNTNTNNNEANTNTTNNEADKNNTSNEANTSEASKTTEAPPVVERKSRRKYTFKYYFYVNEQRVQVCKAFYLGTLNISQSPIYSAHETKNPITNTANEDMRGKNPSCRRKPEGNKEYAREHIRSFPTVKSHCCVASKKMKYLDGHLSVAKMYDLYLQKCIEIRMDPVKKSMYHHIFSTEFNLSFLKPPSSKSHKCHS